MHNLKWFNVVFFTGVKTERESPNGMLLGNSSPSHNTTDDNQNTKSTLPSISNISSGVNSHITTHNTSSSNLMNTLPLPHLSHMRTSPLPTHLSSSDILSQLPPPPHISPEGGNGAPAIITPISQYSTGPITSQSLDASYGLPTPESSPGSQQNINSMSLSSYSMASTNSLNNNLILSQDTGSLGYNHLLNSMVGSGSDPLIIKPVNSSLISHLPHHEHNHHYLTDFIPSISTAIGASV